MDILNKKVILNNDKDTRSFAYKFASFLSENKENRIKIIYFNGDLGAGKTTFVQGFLNYFNFEGFAKSPTYTLIEEYYLKNIKIVHCDFYRLVDEEEFEWLGLADIIEDCDFLLIEWPEKCKNLLPKPNYKINLSYYNINERLVNIEQLKK